ncbi:hypothetical protein [Qipengyuania sp.]|uniref:hypothetical protein n=1 Tax=Qipengyuania sp. TaxID=2004515 RepID=UPI003BAC3ACB
MSSLKKIEGFPALREAADPARRERFLVLIKLAKDASVPDYTACRARFGRQIYSAEVDRSVLERLEHDPAVEAVSISRDLPLID